MLEGMVNKIWVRKLLPLHSQEPQPKIISPPHTPSRMNLPRPRFSTHSPTVFHLTIDHEPFQNNLVLATIHAIRTHTPHHVTTIIIRNMLCLEPPLVDHYLRRVGERMVGARLKHLRLEVWLRVEALSWFMKEVALKSRLLTVIELPSSEVGDAVVGLIQQAEFRFIRELDLNHNQISSEGVRLLSQCIYPFLTRLSLCSNPLSNRAIPFLVKSQWPLLYSLELSSTSLTSNGLRVLAKAQWPQLHILIVGEGFTHQGLRWVLRGDWRRLQLVVCMGEGRRWEEDEDWMCSVRAVCGDRRSRMMVKCGRGRERLVAETTKKMMGRLYPRSFESD